MPTQLLFGVNLIELISLRHAIFRYKQRLQKSGTLEQKSLTCFPDRLDVVIILFTAIIAYVIDGLGTRL